MAHIFRRLAEHTKNTLLSSAKSKKEETKLDKNKNPEGTTEKYPTKKGKQSPALRADRNSRWGYHKMPKCRKRNRNTRK